MSAADARPSRFVGGERIDAAISEINFEKRKVSLSIKLLEEIMNAKAIKEHSSPLSGKNLPFSSLSEQLDDKKNKKENSFDESKIDLGGESNVKNENIDGYVSGSDGISFSLDGRNVSLRILPDYDVQDEGIVVVLITVNRNGIVTNAITGSKGTTTFNKNLLLKAKQAALKTRFSVNNNAPISQQGKIIYNFKLN